MKDKERIFPVTICNWEEKEGKVVIKREKIKGKILRKILLPLFFSNRPFYYIYLDEIGSFVWKLCNGEHSIADIENRLKEKFGPLKDLEERLLVFFQQLLRARLIEFREGGKL